MHDYLGYSLDASQSDYFEIWLLFMAYKQHIYSYDTDTDILITQSHHYAYSLSDDEVIFDFQIVKNGYYRPISAIILILEG